MYLSQRDVKALKIILKQGGNARHGKRTRVAIARLNKTITQNDKKVLQQRRMIESIMQVPDVKSRG